MRAPAHPRLGCWRDLLRGVAARGVKTKLWKSYCEHFTALKRMEAIRWRSKITGLPSLDRSKEMSQWVHDMIKERAHEIGCLLPLHNSTTRKN